MHGPKAAARGSRTKPLGHLAHRPTTCVGPPRQHRREGQGTATDSVTLNVIVMICVVATVLFFLWILSIPHR